MLFQYFSAEINNLLGKFLRLDNCCISALMHYLCYEAKLGHFLHMDFTTSVLQRHYFLLNVQWPRLDDPR